MSGPPYKGPFHPDRIHERMNDEMHRMTVPDPRTADLLCPDCGHHIHRPKPCQWAFGAGENERPCPCPRTAEETTVRNAWGVRGTGAFDAASRTAEERLRALWEGWADESRRLMDAAFSDPAHNTGSNASRADTLGRCADMLRAALAADPVPAPLDVERLALAIAFVVDCTRSGVILPVHLKEAAAIAREYAALATPPEPDDASEYGRLLAERDRLLADGADPDDLLVPDPPATPPEPEP